MSTISTFPAGFLLADRYRIVRVIGQGGMGVVYLAEDTQLNDDLRAIKTIRPELLADMKVNLTLKKEAVAAMRLSHHLIVTSHNFEKWNDLSFIVMEYVEGQTLADYLLKKGNLSIDEFLPLAEQICRALDFAHNEGYVHQDIKPSNIFVEERDRIKIADFSIARVIKDATTRLTGAFPSGTLVYMSPEVLRGEKPTIASDIYSTGITFYEMLNGTPPFMRGDIFSQHQTIAPSRMDGLPEKLNLILLQALEKNPQNRPETCLSYWNDISGFFDKQGPVTDAIEADDQLKKQLSDTNVKNDHLEPLKDNENSIQLDLDESTVPEEYPKKLGLSKPQNPTPRRFLNNWLYILFAIIVGVLILYPFISQLIQSDSAAEDLLQFSIAAKRNTIESWQNFIDQNPQSEWKVEATRRLNELIELDRDSELEKAFIKATKENTVLSYQIFLIRYPDTKYTESVKKFIDSLESAPDKKEFQRTAPGNRRNPTVRNDKRNQIQITETLSHDMIENSLGMKFKLIQAGTFMMGSNDGKKDARPVRPITISKAFFMGVYEVTEKQYESLMKTRSTYYHGPNYPKTYVTWEDASEFCKKLSELTRAKYRLPTEAEWEYVCRAGTTTKFHWGNDANMADDFAWYHRNSNNNAQPVGQKLPNAWGIYDMAGNVWEWCLDSYSVNSYANNDFVDPVNQTASEYRAVRGGSWYFTEKSLGSAYRGKGWPKLSDNGNYGFRVVREIIKGQVFISN